MIKKEKFVEYMNYLKERTVFEDSLFDLLQLHEDVVSPFIQPVFDRSPDFIIELIEDSIGLTIDETGYSSLSHYIYELNFGEADDETLKNSFELNDLPEDHKYKYPYLVTKTFEDLYDYLVWEVEVWANTEYDKEKKVIDN